MTRIWVVVFALFLLFLGEARAQESHSDVERSEHGTQRVAAALGIQDTLRRLDGLEPEGIVELRIELQGNEVTSAGFVVEPGFAVFPLAQTNVTLRELSNADLRARAAYGEGDWDAVRVVAHSVRCGCFVARLRDRASVVATLSTAQPFRGQVVWARGPMRSTLLGIVSNEREVYLELDMANRGNHYGPVYDLDGGLVGLITHRINREGSELADVYFAIPSRLMALEASSMIAANVR